MDDRFRVAVWPDGPYAMFSAAQNQQHLVRVLASSIPVPTRQFRFVDRPVHRGISTRSVHSPQVSSIHPLSTELAGGLVFKVPSPSIVTFTTVDVSVESGRHQYQPGFDGLLVDQFSFALSFRIPDPVPALARRTLNSSGSSHLLGR
jgi:hypothetical protein